jgi:predicted ATP-grasp superfamily ATP-dependent carboligase
MRKWVARIPVWFATRAGPHRQGAADWLVELSASHRPERWVLFAGGDEEVRLGTTRCCNGSIDTTPPWEIVAIACDKRLHS